MRHRRQSCFAADRRPIAQNYGCRLPPTSRAGSGGAHNITVVARLRPEIPLAAADADVKRIASEVAREHPDYREWNARVVPLGGWVTESSERSMTLLAAAVGFVLLLA